MARIVISDTGVYTPPFAISNEELVASFNTFVETFNRVYREAKPPVPVSHLLNPVANSLRRLHYIEQWRVHRFVQSRVNIILDHHA